MSAHGADIAPFAQWQHVSAALAEGARAARIGYVVVVDEGAGPRIASAQGAIEEILGYTPEEMVGRSPLEPIAPEYVAEVRERYGRRLRGEPVAPSAEFEVVRKDGARVRVEISVGMLLEPGQSLAVVFFQDVTLRQAADDAMRRSELRFRTLIEGAPEAIAVVHAGVLMYCNPAYARLLGCERVEQVVGTAMVKWIHPEDLDRAVARWRAMLSAGCSSTEGEYRILRLDGGVTEVEMHCIAIELDGVLGMLGFARDVTERNRAREHLARAERLAALGTIAAGMAHEVNNPLAYALLSLDALAAELPRLASDPARLSRAQGLLADAREGAARIRALVDTLRASARPQGEAPEVVDVRAAVEGAIRMAANEIRHRGQLRTEFDAVPSVRAEPVQLGQVFLNLLVNAAQSLPDDDALAHTIRVATGTDADGRAVIEVEDDGPGIAPEQLGRIFEPFFTTKPAGVGMGLGLSLCQRVVAALGGEITVCSAPGQGACFRVVLPAADDAGAAVAGALGPRTRTSRPPPPPERAGAEQGASARPRVLVVDDEPALARALARALEEQCDPVLATGAREALALLERERFDLVLCDLMMPGMTGMDLYEQLAARRPGAEERVVFMTGGAFTPRAQDFLAAVPNARIDKPFDETVVRALVRVWLEG